MRVRVLVWEERVLGANGVAGERVKLALGKVAVGVDGGMFGTDA